MGMSYHHALKRYKEARVLGLSPSELVLMTYEDAINACRQHDAERATSALRVLRHSLEGGDNSLAAKLNQLYYLCLQLIGEQRFGDALLILSTMRDALRDDSTVKDS